MPAQRGAFSRVSPDRSERKSLLVAGPPQLPPAGPGRDQVAERHEFVVPVGYALNSLSALVGGGCCVRWDGLGLPHRSRFAFMHADRRTGVARRPGRRGIAVRRAGHLMAVVVGDGAVEPLQPGGDRGALFYTAVTRPRKKVWVAGSDAEVVAALGRRVARATGLGLRLRWARTDTLSQIAPTGGCISVCAVSVTGRQAPTAPARPGRTAAPTATGRTRCARLGTRRSRFCPSVPTACSPARVGARACRRRLRR